MTGIEMVMWERRRHEGKGYTAEYDDKFVSGELAIAGACHAVAAVDEEADIAVLAGLSKVCMDDAFPWEPKYDTRDNHTRIENLVIAGALICAEIDRLQRLEENLSRGDAEGAEKKTFGAKIG